MTAPKVVPETGFEELGQALTRALVRGTAPGTTNAPLLAVAVLDRNDGFPYLRQLVQAMLTDTGESPGIAVVTPDKPEELTKALRVGDLEPPFDLAGQVRTLTGRCTDDAWVSWLKIPVTLPELREWLGAMPTDDCQRRTTALRDVLNHCQEKARTCSSASLDETATVEGLIRHDPAKSQREMLALEHEIKEGTEYYGELAQRLAESQCYVDHGALLRCLLTSQRVDAEHTEAGPGRRHLVIEDHPDKIRGEIKWISTHLPNDCFWITKPGEAAKRVAEAVGMSEGGAEALQLDLCDVVSRGDSGHCSRKCAQPESVGDFDVVWVDLLLGTDQREAADGIRIVRKLRERHPAVICGVLSWSEDLSVMSETLKAGADIYLPKRRIARLPHAVDEVLTKAWPSQTLREVNTTSEEDRERRLRGTIRRWQHEPGILWHGEKTFHIVDHSLKHHLTLWGMADRLVGQHWQMLRSRFEALKILRPKKRPATEAGDYLFTLLMAIWLHDIGLKGDSQASSPPEVRYEHGLIAARLLKEAAKDKSKLRGIFGLDDTEWRDVATLCLFHQSNAPIVEDAKAALTLEHGPKHIGSYLKFLRELQPKEGNPKNPPTLETVALDLVPLAFLLRLLDGMDYCWDRVGGRFSQEAWKDSVDNDLKYYSDRVDSKEATIREKDYSVFLSHVQTHLDKHGGVAEQGIHCESSNGMVRFWPYYLLSPNEKGAKAAKNIPHDVWREWEPVDYASDGTKYPRVGAKKYLPDKLGLELGSEAPEELQSLPQADGEYLVVGDSLAWVCSLGKSPQLYGRKCEECGSLMGKAAPASPTCLTTTAQWRCGECDRSSVAHEAK